MARYSTTEARSSKMQQSLVEVGILPEAASVAVQQYTALLNVDPMLAGNYAREVQDNVTGAYYRIMLMYKSKMGDDFDEEQDFMEEYVSSLVQRNMDYLITSFQQSFAGDISKVEEHVSYDGYSELSTANYVGDYQFRKQQETKPVTQQKKQVTYGTQEEQQKPLQKRQDYDVQGTSGTRTIRQKFNAKRSLQKREVKSFDTVKTTYRKKTIGQRVKSAFNKAVSAIKGLFKRGK